MATRVLGRRAIPRHLAPVPRSAGGEIGIVRTPPRIALPAGSVLTCPNPACSATIAEARRDIYDGQGMLQVEYLEFARGQERGPQDDCACRRCGAGYIRDTGRTEITRIYHTERGWV